MCALLMTAANPACGLLNKGYMRKTYKFTSLSPPTYPTVTFQPATFCWWEAVPHPKRNNKAKTKKGKEKQIKTKRKYIYIKKALSKSKDEWRRTPNEGPL